MQTDEVDRPKENQSTESQSKVSANISSQQPVNSFDEVPIGGGTKFNFSQFPEEENTKSVVKKTSKLTNKREETKKVEDNVDSKQQETPVSKVAKDENNEQPVNSFDQVPIGGGTKFNFSQFPEEQQKNIKPVKKANKLTKETAKIENNESKQQEITSKSKDMSNEQPVNTFDEVPIGGGTKFNFSQFPEEGNNTKPVVKKTSKLTKKNKDAQKIENKVQIHKLEAQSKESETFKNNKPLQQIPVDFNINNFDQKPIGKTAFQISEFPEGEEQPTVEVNYPMLQKLKSKAAKLRLSGMQDLLNMLNDEPNNPDLTQIDISKFLKEITPANIEKIEQCLKLWIEKGRNWGEDEVKGSIQNGYINGKGNAKKVALEVLDLMYEQKSAIVQMTILVGMKNKTPKILAGYLSALSELLSIYGIKKMKYFKPYFPQLVRIITNQKAVAVKTQGLNLLKETYKWIGKQAVDPLISNLKDAIKKQLDVFWESYDQSIVMTAPKDVPNVENDGKSKSKKVDAYDLSQAVDVFKKFNQKWSEGVLKAQKWNQKTKMMEQFVKAASVPKLANSQFRHITQMIKRLINDSNFNVVLWDLRILGVLSRGLRKSFYPVVKVTFSNVLSKFRDKKTQMIDETFNTLNDFMYSISIEDVIEDLKEGFNDKAPNMKVNLVNWVGKFVERRCEQKGDVPERSKDAIRSLFPIFEKLLGDGTADVRNCMAKNIGKMKMLIGQDFFNNLQNKMNKSQVAKLSDGQKSVKVKPKSKQKNQDMSKSTLNKSGAKNNQSDSKLKPQIKSHIIEKRQQLKLEYFNQPSFEESCTKLIEQGFPQECLNSITSSDSKQRTKVLTLIKEEGYPTINCTIRVLKKLFKDWKEVNLLMNKELISYIESVASMMEKPEAYILLPYIIQKVGDTKFSQSLNRTIEVLCTRIPATFIVGHIIQYIKSTEGKKPKINSDACFCIARIIGLVSINNIPIPEAIQFGKATYQVNFSKKGGTELLTTIYSHIGDQIKIFLDIAVFKSLQSEFKDTKLLGEADKIPKLNLTGQVSQNSTKKQPINFVESKTKVDITNQIIKVLPKMNDQGNWQYRKDNAEFVIGLINENHGRVTINCMNDLVAILKTRINDSNKQLIRTFVHLTGLVFQVMSEKEVKTYSKGFICGLIEGLSDKTEANRKQIIASLSKIGEVVSMENLLSNIGSYLEGEKDSRAGVLHFILDNDTYLPKTDLREYPKGLVCCLCDKNKQIRGQAEKLYERIFERIGVQTFKNLAKDQRPAFTKDLNAFFDKFDKVQRHQMSNSMIHSKGNSPAKPEKKPSSNAPPSVSGKKRSLSKSHINKSFAESEQNDKSRQYTIPMPRERRIIEGDDLFAPLKILAAERIERQEEEEKNPWRTEQIRQSYQDDIRQQIQRLFRSDISRNMLAFDHKRVLDSIIKLSKTCKDITHQAHIREIYDIIVKWAFLRLWGGNPALLSVIQIFPPMMSILQKKGLVLNDAEVDLVLAVVRQYMISAYMNEFNVSESLHTVIKCLIILSSGQKVLRKVLKQMKLDISTFHRHIKKEVNQFYRNGLVQLIKTQLIKYIGSQDTLEQSAKIKQLRQDVDFVDMLYRKFHENVLNPFGFRKLGITEVECNYSSKSPDMMSNIKQSRYVEKQNEKYVDRQQQYQQQRQQQQQQKQQQQHKQQQKQQLQQKQQQQKINKLKKNSDKLDKNTSRNIEKDKSVELPPRSNLKNNKSTIINTNRNSKSRSNSKNKKDKSMRKGDRSYSRIDQKSNHGNDDFLDLSIYPAPHPSSPLGKYLSRLLPPNEAIINFFSSLFVENGQKLSNELVSYAKIIFGSILKSVIDMLNQRSEYTPEKIVNQINLLQQSIKCVHIIKNIGQLLYHATNFTLTQLVYQDENKNLIYEDLKNRNIDYKTQNFIKVINGVMLRILQNSCPQEVINILFMLLVKNTKAISPSQKTIYLIIKCVTRVTSNYKNTNNLAYIKPFFIVVNEYLTNINFDQALEEFHVPQNQKPKPEDNALNSIKSVIFELCRQYNSDIWNHYEQAMQEAKFPDEHISSYITSLNIKKIQKQLETPHKQNKEMKKISDLLSKKKTFETGIHQLKVYLSLHQHFNIVQYFSGLNYDQKFITLVSKSLNTAVSRTPIKQTIREDKSQNSKSGNEVPGGNNAENIQDKIKKLKQKFEQLQPNKSEQSILQQFQTTSTLNNNSKLPTTKDMKQERTQEIRRRIDQMKNKISKP